MNQTLLVSLIVFAGLLGFVGIWLGIIGLLAYLSGWQRLAKLYGTTAEIPGGWDCDWAQIGRVSYRQNLTISCTDQGLSLRIMFPFRIFHPPLLIPWSVITDIITDTYLFRPAIIFRVNGVRMILPSSFATRIQKYVYVQSYLT